MSSVSFMEKLLDGARVEWFPLEQIAKIKHGKDWKGLNSGNIPVYGSGGIMGYVDAYSYSKPTVLIPRKGSITNIFYVETPFWNVDTIYYTEIDTSKVVPKYLYHFVKTLDLMSLDTGSGRPSLTQAILNDILVPVPCPDSPRKSLEIQDEIVRILDAFTELAAALTAELSARKRQYNYYRDQLLGFEGVVVEWKELGDIGDVRMCRRILKNETQPEGDVPFYKIGTFGKKADSFISSDVYEAYRIRYSFPRKGDVLISAAGTIGRAVIYDGEPAYFQDSNIVWLDNDESVVTNKYLWHFYKIAKWFVSEGGTIDRLYNDNIRKTKIPVPYPGDREKSLAEQDRVVAILDKFDTLTSSVGEGLPREIELRQKQYEYYRDQLLGFRKPEELEA